MTLSSGEKQHRLFRWNAKASTKRIRNSRISAFGALGNLRFQQMPVQARCQYVRIAFRIGGDPTKPPAIAANAQSPIGNHFAGKSKYQKATNSPARNKPAITKPMNMRTGDILKVA
jgi:hypothetical protein